MPGLLARIMPTPEGVGGREEVAVDMEPLEEALEGIGMWKLAGGSGEI